MRNNIFRYYYWLFLEFFKKHGRLMVISFFISFIGIIGFLSVSPFIKTALEPEEIVGLIGNYSVDNPPEEIVNKVSNGLVTVTDKGEIIPVIANSWEIKNSGKEYRFHLKDNLLWSNGKKFTAQDIAYQFKDVEVIPVDDKTVDFSLKKPLAIFPTYLNRPLIKYPILGVAGFYKTGKIKTQYGYLKEVSLIPNTKNLTPVTYKFYGNESSLVNAYKKGEVNKITLTKKSVADIFLNWKNSVVEKNVDHSRLLTLFFNSDNPVLANKNIKDAIALAFDYQKLSEYGEIAKGPIQPESWAYNPNLKSPNYDAANSQIIIKNEITASESAKLNFSTSYDYYDVADQLSNSLKAVDLENELNFTSIDGSTPFDLFLAFWTVPKDPDQYYFWHSTQTVRNGGGNIGAYKNVKIDKLLEQGRDTINLDDREKAYFDFQKNIQDDPPAIFLYYPYVYTIKRK
ncbi:MAG: ABC transporter substrate-binding protein [Patescibacteria group bacterium]